MAEEPKWLSALSEQGRKRIEKGDQPQWTAPMLATLTDEPFDDDDWVFERKLDGVRLLGFIEGGKAHIRSRNDKALDGRFPEIREALEKQVQTDAIVDGEVVAFDGDVTSFQRLQARTQKSAASRRKQEPVYAYLFDVLHVDGYDVARLPLLQRKAILKSIVDWQDPLRFTQHRKADGTKYHAQACTKGWEGLIAKRADAAYRHSRSRDWLKVKCNNSQELVIVGFTDPQGSRHDFGSLLLGYYLRGAKKNDRLTYAGKVGTGFDSEMLKRLGEALRDLEREQPPVADAPQGKGVHFVDPKLVAQIGFTEWTRDGRLRHPRFLGLRDDKSPREVVKERPR